jgi:hypothetical protein
MAALPLKAETGSWLFRQWLMAEFGQEQNSHVAKSVDATISH